MLESITIKNIALIDSLTIEFSGGLNVLSGETGAGKSLIIDSISLLLGERADKGLISVGEKFASVEAVFTISNEIVKEVLAEFGLENEEKVIISRKITTDGKNECRVNGQTFTLSMLKQLTAPLMDLHGQFEHQALLNVASHIKVLDNYGKKQIAPIKDKFAKEFVLWQNLMQELKGFTVDEKERERLIDLYNYQINEIEEADFKDEEEETLKALQLKFSHAEKIAQNLADSLELLSGASGGDALSLIAKSGFMLSQIAAYDPKIEEINKQLQGIKLDLEDMTGSISDVLEAQEYDEFEVKRVEDRLDLLFSFKKKYGATIEEINNYLKDVKKEQEKLTNCAHYLQELVNKKDKAQAELLALGQELTAARKSCADSFCKEVTCELEDIGMKNSKFEVNFILQDLEHASACGQDKIEFLFSANIGQPTRPLAKVISGGEMSRFMLAIKNITASLEGIETMIFDEIDTGVSGAMAKVLARKMQKVGSKHQVLCVTHMAQICAFADNNFFISKQVLNGKTNTHIKKITGQEKVEEVARLVGSSSSATAIEHAKELILEAKQTN